MFLKIFMEKSSKKFEELLGTQIELDKLGINAEDINISNKKEKDSDNKSKDNEEESILNKFNKAYCMER